MYESDIYDLQKRLTQTWVDSQQNVMEAVIDHEHDRLRSCVHVSGGHFEHMLCGSSEHFVKLSM